MESANSGIGYGLAHELARQGHHVILGCRSEHKCKSAEEKINVMKYSGKVVSAPGLDLNSLVKTKSWAVRRSFPSRFGLLAFFH